MTCLRETGGKLLFSAKHTTQARPCCRWVAVLADCFQGNAVKPAWQGAYRYEANRMRLCSPVQGMLSACCEEGSLRSKQNKLCSNMPTSGVQASPWTSTVPGVQHVS